MATTTHVAKSYTVRKSVAVATHADKLVLIGSPQICHFFSNKNCKQQEAQLEEINVMAFGGGFVKRQWRYKRKTKNLANKKPKFNFHKITHKAQNPYYDAIVSV